MWKLFLVSTFNGENENKKKSLYRYINKTTILKKNSSKKFDFKTLLELQIDRIIQIFEA